MKKSEVVKNFIKITGVDQYSILQRSGIKFVNIRTGNRFHSTRNVCIPNYSVCKRNWDVVIHSYSKVEDPRYFKGRELEMSEIYLNPKYKFLLDLNREMIEVTEDEYLNFISKVPNLNAVKSINRFVISQYNVRDINIMKFMPLSNMPILAKKSYELANNGYIVYHYYLISSYKDYLEGKYYG